MATTRASWPLRYPALIAGLRRARQDSIDLTLAADGTWSGRLRADRVEVRCESGVVWITVEGDVEDHVLSAGETFVCARPGRVAMMALQPARVLVTGCSEHRSVRAAARRLKSSAA